MSTVGMGVFRFWFRLDGWGKVNMSLKTEEVREDEFVNAEVMGPCRADDYIRVISAENG